MDIQQALGQQAKVAEFLRKHRIGLLTLLFTDTAGSTRLKQELGDLAAVPLIQKHNCVVRELLRGFREAEEIETAGDSFFIVFAKPSDAVRFALMLEARLRALAQESGQTLIDRIGIHIGEVVIEEHPDQSKALYGMQVDTCARVMSLAEGGQVLLTRAAFDNARQVLKGQDLDQVGGLAWLNHGPYLFKGVEEPVEICEVGEAGKAPLQPPPDVEKARRHVSADAEPVLGWRPALDQVVPKTQWMLQEKLGEGGFGEVWLGRHQTLKEQRVFKFCFRADRVRPLKREVTLFRLLKERIGHHPNIVGVQEVNFEEPPYYIMMDYSAAKDLPRWCEGQGGLERIPWETRLEIVAQIAEALQAAHDSGVIHRDVKPSNILVSPGASANAPPLAKLTDFGIGQVVSAEVLAGVTGLGFTQTAVGGSSSSSSGTYLYMAPELLAGSPATTRSDIYGLGVVLFQLVVGDFSRPVTVDWVNEIADPFLRDDLHQCFAGNAQERFAGAGLLAANLRGLERRRAAQREQRAAHRRGIARAVLATVAALTIVPLTAWWLMHRNEVRSGAEALRNLGAVYGPLATYQDTAEINQREAYANTTAEVNYSSTLSWARPGKFRMSIKVHSGSQELELLVISDGAKVWDVRPLTHRYAVLEGSNSVTGLIKKALEGDATLLQLMPAMNLYYFLLDDNPQATFAREARNLRFARSEKLDGSPSYVFAWEKEYFGIKLPVMAWQSKRDGLIRQMSFDLSPLSQGSQITSNFVTETHRNIQVNAKLDLDLFVFQPPTNATRLEIAQLDTGAPAEPPYPSFGRATLARTVPEREAAAKPRMIDLTRYFTCPLTESWTPGPSNNDLSSLPRGPQTLAGIEFDVRGLVQLTSAEIKSKGGTYPAKVGIPLGGACRRLHFLQGAILGDQTRDGLQIGSYVVHYSNGEEDTIPIIQGGNVADWWDWSAGTPTNAVVAWEGANPASRVTGHAIRLFKSTWENPRPDRPVEKIDFVSSLARQEAPFLVALTVDLADGSSNPALGSPSPASTNVPAKGIPLDLSAYYNADLTSAWSGAGGGLEGNNLSTLPRGWQTFGGVRYDVRGIVQVSSRSLRLATAAYPDMIKGIKVKRRCARLYFLQASSFAGETTEKRIGSYSVHYTNGEQRELPIVYGKTVRDWWDWEPQIPPESTVAWTGTNQASLRNGKGIRLFQTAWENPLPEIEIESLDFVSSMATAAPFVVSISTEPPR
jgi:class 3 adenylate cyclase/outer membrane lipoprotein-sorting protein/tRNA A-37 threonylcarbamoyl transferase component Bud32